MADTPEQYVTRSTFEGVLERTGKAIRGAIDRALDPIASRVSNLEFKAGALALALARGDPEQRTQLVQAEAILQRLAALEDRSTPELREQLEDMRVSLESAELRLARYAERLTQLERI